MKPLPLLALSLILTSVSFGQTSTQTNKKLIGDPNRFVRVKPPPGLFIPRNVASLDSEKMITLSESRVRFGNVYAPTFDDDSLIKARFSILGGRTYAPPGDAMTPQGQWLGGVSAEAQIARYLGVSADGAYAFTGSRSQSADSGTVTHTTNYSSSQATVHAQLPFRTGLVGWIPKLGLGYGTLSSTSQDQYTGDASSNTNSTLHLSAPLATLGLEVDFYGKLSASVDYSRSFAAKATEQDTGQDSLSLSGSSFDRTRLTLFYRIIPHVGVGGQYAHRSWQAPGSSQPDGSQDQILALVQFEL
jgi:hypothetical protein